MPLTSFAAHYLELPHVEGVHASLHRGDVSVPIWFELTPATHSTEHAGDIYPPINYFLGAAHTSLRRAPIMPAVTAVPIHVAAKPLVDIQSVQASPFVPGRVRRFQVYGPVVGDGNNFDWFPIHTAKGDRVVYACAGVDTGNCWLELNQVQMDDWIPQNFHHEVGVINITEYGGTTPPTLARVKTAEEAGTAVVVLAIYRDVNTEINALTTIDADSGTVPQQTLVSPDGGVKAVRAFSYDADPSSAVDISMGRAEQLVVGQFGTACVGIFEEELYVGPPIPSDTWSTPTHDDGTDVNIRTAIFANTDLDNLPIDEDDPVPVGNSQIPG